jgi:hypothetical protein
VSRRLTLIGIARKEAQAAGLTRFFTGEPCSHGHCCERYVLNNGQCLECKRIADLLRPRAKFSSDRECIFCSKKFNAHMPHMRFCSQICRGKNDLEKAKGRRRDNPGKQRALDRIKYVRSRDSIRACREKTREKRQARTRAYYRRCAAALRALRELGIEV